MKNLVRAFALSLVVTGAVASSQISNNPTSTTLTGKISAPPVPMCPPDDPKGCNIASLGR